MPTGTQQTFEGLVCILCNNVLVDGDLSNLSDEICDSCDFEHTIECQNCGEHSFDGNSLPYQERRRLTAHGVPYTTFINCHDSGEYVCQDCVYNCDNCGTYYQWEDSTYECCRDSSVINSYCYRPVPIFYSVTSDTVVGQSRANRDANGLSDLYMGVELEIAKMSALAGDFDSMLSPKSRDFVYMKEDGSLGPDGVELVTMPATLDAFKKMFPFSELDWARLSGARSYAYPACGFHIHVSRSAFTATHLWKFVRFQLQNASLCQRIAQRGENSYASWYYEESEQRSIPDYVKGKKSNGRRYLAINFQNTNTVELRYFKGNILRGAILKNLEFVQSMYEYTRDMTVSDVMTGGLREGNYLVWLDERAALYPNLIHFLYNDSSKEEE